MSLFFESAPYHIGENGAKWWLDQTSTDYAQSRGLDDVVVWFVEETDGRRTRLVTCQQEIIHENQSLEALGVWLDALALDRDLD